MKKEWRSDFEPQAIKAMSQVFDEICQELAIPATAEAEREVIAERVIGVARKGERNPERLRKAALKNIGMPPRFTGL